MEVRLTYGDGSTEQFEVDNLAGLLDEIDAIGWFERKPGHYARVVSVHVFDAAQYEEARQRLSELRLEAGRGLGRSWPPPSHRT